MFATFRGILASEVDFMSLFDRVRKRVVLVATLMTVLVVLLAVGLYARTGIAVLPVSASATEQGVPVPILMYHSILENPGTENKYVISIQTFRDDLQYLKEQGYTAIFISDLMAYADQGTPLPEKPVIITIDDGMLNNLSYALPALEEYDMKAAISIVGCFSQMSTEQEDPNPHYAHLTWEDIRTMNGSGRVEICNHTYNMHELDCRRGCTKNKGESEGQYQNSLRQDLEKLQTLLIEQSGVQPNVFCYPYGFISSESLPVLKEMGFRAALSCIEKVNYITGDPEQLYCLYRFNRPCGISTAEFMKKILP